MKRNKNQSAGFTLVEVMVVVIIIAVLAAVAIPLMSGNVKRAIATEGIAGLGTIRSNMRAMLAETGAYNLNLDTPPISPTNPVDHIPGFSAGDLTGRYFDDNDYTITCTASNFLAKVKGDGVDTKAKGAKRAQDFEIYMTSQGTIRLTGKAGDDTVPSATD